MLNDLLFICNAVAHNIGLRLSYTSTFIIIKCWNILVWKGRHRHIQNKWFEWAFIDMWNYIGFENKKSCGHAPKILVGKFHSKLVIYLHFPSIVYIGIINQPKNVLENNFCGTNSHINNTHSEKLSIYFKWNFYELINGFKIFWEKTGRILRLECIKRLMQCLDHVHLYALITSFNKEFRLRFNLPFIPLRKFAAKMNKLTAANPSINGFCSKNIFYVLE